MKAILLVDLPSSCQDCILCVCDMDSDYICSALTEQAKGDYSSDLFEVLNEEESWAKGTRYELCPLEPMPEKKESSLIVDGEKVNSAYEEGWNDCLDEISGEENE